MCGLFGKKKNPPASSAVAEREDGPRVATGPGIACARENVRSGNRNAGGQSEDDRPGPTPGSDNSTRTQDNSSPVDRVVGGQLAHDGLGMAANSHDNARARTNSDSADENSGSQQRRGGPGAADGSGGAGRTRKNPHSANRDVERSLRRRNSERGDRANSGPQNRPGSRGNSGSNPDGRDRDYRGPARMPSLNHGRTRTQDGPETTRAPDNGVYSHRNGSSRIQRSPSSGTPRGVGAPAGGGIRNAGHSQTRLDTAATEDVDQTRDLDSLGGSTSEVESSTRNQNPNEVQDAFDRITGHGMAEEESSHRNQNPSEVQDTFDHITGHRIGEGNNDMSITNASIEHRNTRGKFSGNFGSYNDYGDKDSKLVNGGKLVNNGTFAVNIIRNDGGEGLKNAATVTREQVQHVPWMVTYCQNKGFTGREGVLRRIESLAQMGCHNRVALWGLGGTGKTQIALKFVYQYEGRRPVFWVHGSSLEKFSEEFKNIGTSQPTIDGEGNKSLASVKEWLESESSGEWILVLDNADNERDFRNNNSPISQYIPQGRKGTLIITTRSKQIASRLVGYSENAIEVPRMTAEEARQLFSLRYGALAHPRDKRAVEDILSSLHHLPLAVVGAAAYMTETSIPPSVYLKMFKSEDVREKLLSQEFNDIYREGPTGVAESVLSTFFITFEQITKEYRQAADLLRLITFMKDHQNIPEDALLLSGLEGMNDVVTAQNTIGKLVGFSLFTKTASSVGDVPVYELHRLVQISAEAYFKKREELAVPEWVCRAQVVAEFASQSRLSSTVSPQQPPEPTGPEIEELD